MNLRRGLFIFMLLSLGVSFLVVRQSLTPEALNVIFDLDWSIAAWIVPAILAAWCCDAGRFLMVSKAMGYRISFWRGLTLTWLNYFGSAITPLQVGGGPFQVYVLYAQDKIPVGSGMAITMLRTLMSTFMLSLLAPSALWLAPELLARYGLARGIYFYVCCLSVVLWCIVLSSVFRPRWIQKVVGFFALRLKRFHRLRKLPVLSIYRRVGREMMNYSHNLRQAFHPGRRRYCFLAFLLSCGYLFCIFSVLPIMVRALGLSVPFDQAVSAQAMLMFTLYFIPTPGGSGVAEGGAAALFGMLVPHSLAGVMAVAWRFFTEHVAILIGGLVALRLIGLGRAGQLIAGEETNLEKKVQDE